MESLEVYLEERRRGLPLVLRRGMVLAELRHCGLVKDGRPLLERWVKEGVLVKRPVPGTVRALYAREDVLGLIAGAMRGGRGAREEG